MNMVPGADLNIANGIREFARATPDRLAVVDGDRELTFAAVGERSNRLASALLTMGLNPGDTVALLMGNRLEYIEIAAALAKAGLIQVPLNPRSPLPELEYIIGHSRAQAIIVDPAFADQLGSVPEGVKTVLSLDEGGIGHGYEQVLESAVDRDPKIKVDERSPFCIAYTSGTTGKPKGVQISHRSRTLTLYTTALEWGLGPGRRTIAVAPMYHGAGFIFGYAGPATGGTVSMLRKWNPEHLLEMVADFRPQSVFLVPTHAQTLRAFCPNPSAKYDTSSLETFYFNASALPPQLKEWVFEAFPHVGVHELYGSTEAGVVANLRPEDARRKIGSVGQPWFMTEVRVVGEDGNPVGVGEPGELFSRSPFLMNGYLDNEEATAECVTEDGFLTSGDIATVDEEGYIYIVDRKKDMIISGGVNIYPREIEDALRGHPEVADVAVIGQPDEVWGEAVVAVVVRSTGSSATEEELTDFLRPLLAGYKLPRHWRFVDSLPRNAAGKILKRALR
ncbi:MAG: AMP-binding protein [Nocardiopsaceae bacterium]|nr:AMP-binding protein [Nocardiopsaceae bacterium]